MQMHPLLRKYVCTAAWNYFTDITTETVPSLIQISLMWDVIMRTFQCYSVRRLMEFDTAGARLELDQQWNIFGPLGSILF